MVRILLVEDNPGDVLMLREAIRQSSLSSADVAVARDGEEALRVILDYKFTPDLILLDLNLPKLGGLEIMERLRSQKVLAPVAIFTSSARPEDKRRAFELGAMDYIIKPLDLEEYTNTVTNALDKWNDSRRTRSAGA